jgi:GAF domain-containing protein
VVAKGILSWATGGDARGGPSDDGTERDRAAMARRDSQESRRAVRATVAAAQALRTSLRHAPAPRTVDLAELARTLQEAQTVRDTLERVVELATRAVPACEHASVTLPDEVTLAATDALARRLDTVQYAAGTGPCLDALASGSPSLSGDLAEETRWGDFPAGAVRVGVHSVLSCRLALGGETLGSLNLYAAAPGAFGPLSVPAATAYAAHAAAALARSAEYEKVVQLRQAVSSNRVIGTAIGMLMSSRRISEAEAFDLLRVASQHSNRKLLDIAAELVADNGTGLRASP